VLLAFEGDQFYPFVRLIVSSHQWDHLTFLVTPIGYRKFIKPVIKAKDVDRFIQFDCPGDSGTRLMRYWEQIARFGDDRLIVGMDGTSSNGFYVDYTARELAGYRKFRDQ
jgi:hypothetical protein